MKLFSFFSFLFSFMTLWAVADDGAGSSSEGNESEGGSESEGNTNGGNEENEEDDTKAELARLKSIVDENERIKAVNTAVLEIQSRHGDFDENKIRNYLLALKESDPRKFQELNNPIGWELIHLQNFAAKEVDNDDFNIGRGGEPVDRSAEIFEQVQKGGVTRADEALALGKYL